MKLRSWAAGMCGLSLLAAGSLTPIRADDLMEIYQLAATRDAEFRAAEAAYLAVLEARPQARSALLPQLNLSADRGRTRTETDGNFFGQNVSNQSDTSDTTSFSLRLDQAIYHREFFVQLRAADASIAQARAERDLAAQNLILRVSEAYFNILAAEDNLQFARAEKEAIGRQLEQAQRRFEVGLIAITDVKEAQSSFDLAIAQEIAAENQVDTSRESLRVVTGQSHKDLAKLSEQLPLLPPEPENIDAWVETSVLSNLELTASREATRAARLQVKRQRAGHYPTLDLIASKTLSDTSGGISGGRDTDEDFIGLRANLPIYSGGRTSSLTREAMHNLRNREELQEQQRRETERQARASYLNVKAGISRVQALRQALVSSQAAAEATEAGFEVGTRTSVDVLLALRETFLAQRNYARSRYDYLLETLRLKSAAGTLAPEDLAGITRWLN